MGAEKKIKEFLNLDYPIGIDSGSHKAQHNLDLISAAIELFLVTRMDLKKNSSDSCSVAATHSKSDEFLIRSIVITEA